MVERILGLLVAFLGFVLLSIGMDANEESMLTFSFAFGFPSIVLGLKLMVG